MIIIYHCYGGSHSSVVASAIHTGVLPGDRVPSREELMGLKRFDRTRTGDIGTLFFAGRDDHGSRIYTMGTGGYKAVVLRAINCLLDLYGLDKEKLLLVDCLDRINGVTRVGGFLSRGMGLVTLGRPLTIIGIQQSYPGLLGLVREVKDEQLAREKRQSFRQLP